ncbi:MAG TPA: hydrolase [Candidatus Scybalocola faecavium]|nr:hydrolase [Candidatus Scybalocola faecavium]
MNYYIADLHLGHSRIIGLDGRPFADVDEMDRVLMGNWNRKVGPDDDVYILGDFCYRAKKNPAWYLQRLSGKKHLIQGNHDSHLINNPEAMGFIESVDKMLLVKDQGERIVLCHFPIAQWNGFFRGAWHIYGHIHQKKDCTSEYMESLPRALNAGCMLHNYEPVSFKELVLQCGKEMVL